MRIICSRTRFFLSFFAFHNHVSGRRCCCCSLQVNQDTLAAAAAAAETVMGSRGKNVFPSLLLQTTFVTTSCLPLPWAIVVTVVQVFFSQTTSCLNSLTAESLESPNRECNTICNTHTKWGRRICYIFTSRQIRQCTRNIHTLKCLSIRWLMVIICIFLSSQQRIISACLCSSQEAQSYVHTHSCTTNCVWAEEDNKFEGSAPAVLLVRLHGADCLTRRIQAEQPFN